MSDFKGVYNNTGVLRRVMLCKPLYYQLIPASDTARDAMDRGVIINKDKVMYQHAMFEKAFQDNGVDIVWVDPNPKQPWQEATRDWGLMTKEGALIGKFRYYERKGEEVNVIKCLEREGIPILDEVQRGAFEGGDCLYLDEKTVAIGFGNRSTLAGVENAAEILKKIGVEVIPVELYARWNHLDMVFSVVAERLAVACSAALPDFFIGFLKGKGYEVIDVPAEQVAGKCTVNLMNLGNHRVLSTVGNPINETLRERGIKVTELEFDQFTIGGGGPHCECHDVDRDR